MNLEHYAQQWMLMLERRKNRMPYTFVWYLLGLGGLFFLFGFLDRAWAYYLEGVVVLAAALILFVVETCWRRIAELKNFLSEYRTAERSTAMLEPDAK
jgi:hypothetical protein